MFLFSVYYSYKKNNNNKLCLRKLDFRGDNQKQWLDDKAIKSTFFEIILKLAKYFFSSLLLASI